MRIYTSVLLILVLSYFAIQPLFTSGFFPMHDDTQVARVSQMAKALSDGHFPVRWVKDLGYGYGYPLFNFYSPFPYYVGGFINLFAIDVLTSTKAMMIIGILFSGIFMYFLARGFWGEIGGVVSGLLYVYAPYHAVDIYVRGAVGEFWAYAFVPLVFLGLWKAYRDKKWRWVIVYALGYAGIILSHNLTAMMITPFLLVAIVLAAIKKQNLFAIRNMLSATLFGLGISAFYWLPALSELGYTNIFSQIGGGADFRYHFVCWQQLWDSPWGFGGSAPGCIDGLSLKIGKLHVITSFLAVIAVLLHWKKDRVRSYVVVLAFGSLLLTSLLMIEVSKPLWEALPFMAFLQYPWRFLLFASFFASFLGGGTIWFLSRLIGASSHLNTVLYVSGAVAAVLLFFNVKLFDPQSISPKTTDDYVSEHNVKWVTSKTSDEYMPRDFKKPMFQEDTVKSRVPAGEIKIDKTQELVFETNESATKLVLVSIAPFPAWQAFIDGHASSYQAAQNGLQIEIPQGSHTVTFTFVSTEVERLGNAISIISIVILFGGILWFQAGRTTRFHL